MGGGRWGGGEGGAIIYPRTEVPCTEIPEKILQCTPDKWTTSVLDQSGPYIQLAHNISD